MPQDTVTLAATPRDLAAKPAHLRAASQIPAVYYGAGVDNLSLQVDYQTFRRTFKSAGESTVLDLLIEGEDKPRKVLVHKVDFHPVSDEFTHIDFVNVNMNKPVTTNVPVHFEGVAPAVKELGGILMHHKTEIQVRCLPVDLPSEILVDISGIAEFTDSLHVSDLKIDREKIEVFDADDVMICNVTPPKTAEQIEEELSEPVGDAVSEETKAEAAEENAAAKASKESDTGGKGDIKD